MEKSPSKFHVNELVHGWPTSRQIEKDGRKVFVPCRPEGYYGLKNRLRLAWAVFTGKADALFWEQQ